MLCEIGGGGGDTTNQPCVKNGFKCIHMCKTFSYIHAYIHGYTKI